MRGLQTLFVSVLGTVVLGTAVGVDARQADDALYGCVDGTSAEAELVGAELCDAAPTAALTARAEADNLQIRAGALVVAVHESSISQVAGLSAGDVIFRVGGVDIETAEAATARLAAVAATADTVVNFLRGGRPYRVKLRR